MLWQVSVFMDGLKNGPAQGKTMAWLLIVQDNYRAFMVYLSAAQEII